MLGAGALGQLRGIVWGGRREEGSGWETRVYLWQIHSIFGKTCISFLGFFITETPGKPLLRLID